MNQKIVAGAIIAIVAVSIIVVVLYQQQEEEPTMEEYEKEFEDLQEEWLQEESSELPPLEPGNILEECGSQETEYLRDLCWLFEATEEIDASKCMNIAERPVRIDCIRTVAVDTGETKEEKLAVCNQFLSDDEPQLYMCHSEVAIEMLDYSICDAMPSTPNDYKSHCTWLVGLEESG